MESPEVENTNAKGIGKAMIIGGWVLFLALTTYFLQEYLHIADNPNTKPLVESGEDGLPKVVLFRNPSGHYVASGAINGRPVTFLLDTGATDVALSSRLADKLELRRLASGISQTANGPVETWSTRLDQVSLGDITMGNVRASILPSMNGDDDVLLGMSFLKHLELLQREDRLELRQVR